LATIPPNTRAVGTVNPAGDMDNVADVLSVLTGTTPGGSVSTGVASIFAAGLYDPRAYGAVGNGVTPDDAAILAAITAMPQPGGFLNLGGAPTAYTITQPIVIPSGCSVIGSAAAPPGKYRDAPIPTQPNVVVSSGSAIPSVIASPAFLAPANASYTATGNPSVFTVSGATVWDGAQVILATGTPPTGLSNNTIYYAVNASGSTTFSLATSVGGSALGSGSTTGTISGVPTPDSAILISGLVVDGSGISGTGNGISLLAGASSIWACGTQNTSGYGILCTNTTSAGTATLTTAVQDEDGVYFCRVYKPGSHGIFIQYTTPGGTITDGYVMYNIVDQDFDGTGIAIYCQNMADWQVIGNHVYACPVGAYQLYSCNEATIADNRADNWGQNSVSATTYVGFNIEVTPFGRTTIRGNRCYTKESAGGGAGNFIYYQIGPGGTNQANEVEFLDNSCRQVLAGTSGTSTGYSFSATGSGSLTVIGVNSPLTAEVGTSGTLISAIPTVSGTVTFPGYDGSVFQSTPANPASTTSTAPVMAGLAVELQPQVTGKYWVSASGMAGTSTTTAIVTITGRYGTPFSSAPAQGAASTGTTFGVQQTPKAAAAGGFAAFNIMGTITGLTPGTTYWADFAYQTANASDPAFIENIQFLFQECS